MHDARKQQYHQFQQVFDDEATKVCERGTGPDTSGRSRQDSPPGQQGALDMRLEEPC